MATLSGVSMKKVIIALTSFVMIAWVGIGAYFLFFQGGPKEVTGEKIESHEAKPEKHEPEPAKHEPKAEKKETAKGKTDSAPTGVSSVITTVSDEDNWRLDVPLDTLNFNDPKERDKARRKIASDIKVGNRKTLAALKESSPEEKEKKAQSEAIETWIAKGTRQDAIQ